MAAKDWERIIRLERYKNARMRPMTLKRLAQAGSRKEADIIQFADWVRVELRNRFAHRLYDFHRLPFFVLCNPSIKATYAKYIRTFDLVSKAPPVKKIEEEQSLAAMLESERMDHEETVNLMGKGAKELKLLSPNYKLDSFLKRFFIFRIGRTVMIDHLAAMKCPLEGWRGCINLKCRPAEIMKARAAEARRICKLTYGVAPNVTFSGETETEFAFIPSHLSFISIEVLKNAMRATVEFASISKFPGETSCSEYILDESMLPPVDVEINKGKMDVSIKVCDKGGGIPADAVDLIWNFGYTSAYDEAPNRSVGRNNFTLPRDLAGYGFGCPLSRAFARFFGGDIRVQTCFGIGTDVYITLNHVGDKEEAMIHEEHEDLKLDTPMETVSSRIRIPATPIPSLL